MATTAAGFGDVRAAPRAVSAGTPGVRLRTGLGVALLVTQWAFVAGVAWDVQWHLAVGRDRPFTAPHLLLLAGIAGSGLCALGGVLWYSLIGRGGGAGASGAERGRGPWCGWGHLPGPRGAVPRRVRGLVRRAGLPPGRRLAPPVRGRRHHLGPLPRDDRGGDGHGRRGHGLHPGAGVAGGGRAGAGDGRRRVAGAAGAGPRPAGVAAAAPAAGGALSRPSWWP